MNRKTAIILLVLLTFFVISFFTNILGALNPSVTESFQLTDTMVSFLPFSLFIAYGLMSIPAGILVEKIGSKLVMILAFGCCFIAALVFSIFPSFPTFLLSLFAIGTGMAALQVVINPLLRVAGGEEHYAFNSVLAQLVFGLASFVSPLVFSWVVTGGLQEYGFETDLQWVSIYWFMAIGSLLMILLLTAYKLPELSGSEAQEKSDPGYRKLLKNPMAWFFFFGIFAYVGAEQGISFWMSKYLENYHGFDHVTAGAQAVSWFWGYMTLGGVLGLVLLKLLDSRLVLKIFTLCAALCLVFGFSGSASISYYSFQFSGFFLAVMYPVIISLALNSVAEHHAAFAGLLMSGIMGGAVLQLLIGFLSDLTSLRTGMMLIFSALGYIFLVAWKAKPLVVNKTVGRPARPNDVQSGG